MPAVIEPPGELSTSPHGATVDADRRLMPPQAAEAPTVGADRRLMPSQATEVPVDLKSAESRHSPPVAGVAPAGRLIPPPAANVPQSATVEASLSHSTGCVTALITVGAVTRWESCRGRWRLRTRLPRTAAMARAPAPLPLPALRGERQGCVLLHGGGLRRHTASERAGTLPPGNRRGRRKLPRPLAG